IYFPLIEPRNITLRVIEGQLKDCDVSGVIFDSIDYKSILSQINESGVVPSIREVSYDLSITSKTCFGITSLVSGSGKLRFTATPGKNYIPRYQAIKRKHKVVILFDYQSLLSES
ncbi:MAG: hypothetical protein QM500_03595, partial [Methylococcales bacterium]